MPIEGRQVSLHAEVYCGACPSCGRFSSLRPPSFHPTMHFTRSFMQTVSAEFVYAPAESLGYKYGIDASTVRRIDREVLRQSQPEPTKDNLESIVVDEKYLGPTCGFVTLVVNARSGEPLYMAPGKDRTALDGFFKSLSAQQRQSIHCIGIDRGNASLASALANIPDIRICYDPYHLIANMNAVVDKMRRAAIKGASYADLQLLRNSRYLLLKSPENLDASGEGKLSWRAIASSTPLTLSKKSYERSFGNVMNASPRGQ